MDNTTLNFFATSPKGLELLLVDELRALGAVDAAEKLAGVTFSGNLALAYKACLWSRLANRILLRLTQVPAATPEELYAGIQTIAWDEHINPAGTMHVNFVCSQSKISHTLFGAQKVKDAIVDQLREKYNTRPNVVRDQPDVSIHVFLLRDVATISIDLAGESLHKRGYRLEQGVAPLKENLAAAILIRAGWKEIATSGGSLFDPMCGSGTLLIEAAYMAGNIAPGLLREYFGFLGWKQHLPDLWNKLILDAKNCGKLMPQIIGYDMDAAAVKNAIANVEAAGLQGKIHIEKRDLAAFTKNTHEGKGLIVVNPPYGERMGEADHLQKLYSQLGEKFKKDFQGWHAAIFTGNPELGKSMGLRAYRHYALYNGAIPCQLLLFNISPEWFVDRSAGGTNQRRFQKAQRSLTDEGQREAVQMLVNRIHKNLKNVTRWARREDISCYRIYDADLPEYAVKIDIFSHIALVEEYRAPKSISPEKAELRLQNILAILPETLALPAAQIYFRQHSRLSYAAQDFADFYPIEESGVKLLINLQHNDAEVGLHLDERKIRSLIGSQAQGKHFLNLYAGSGATTIFAARGGALTTKSVVVSQFEEDWIEQNLILNELVGHQHTVVVTTAMDSYLKHEQERFDLIFVELREEMRDERVFLLREMVNLLASKGVLYLIARHPRFKLDKELSEEFSIQEITRVTMPPDFARNAKIHQCWVIQKMDEAL